MEVLLLQLPCGPGVVAPTMWLGDQPHMHVMAIHPSSRVTCPWHGIRSGPGHVHTLRSPLTYTHNKCSSQTDQGSQERVPLAS